MLKTKKRVNSEYHFVRCLGEGLSSTVYEAVRSNSSGIQNEQVAVKILKSENSVSWLQNEFESLRRVNSPHCVRVLGHESFEEGPGIILELIDGVTLFELGQKFKLSDSEISQIGAQVCTGLHAIDAAGFAHGDLNPKNILISRSGDVKLIDFGSFSHASELIGSLPYISEQVWRGERARLESDLASWNLIACDLRSQFRNLPANKDEARSRACATSKRASEVSIRTELADSLIAKESIALKAQSLLAISSNLVSTAVIFRDSRSKSAGSIENRIFRGALALIVLAVIFPAQDLLSEPLKAAEKPMLPASLLIRTHAWTEVAVNGKTKGYAPVTLHNLPPGNYRIKYRGSRGEGEMAVSLNPGQKRLLKDADFKYTNSRNDIRRNNRGSHESRSDRGP